jgi:hypothetical protein
MSTDSRKLLLEGAAIVASILIAFAIDSSWDEFQETKQRQHVIAALHSDFQLTYAGAISTAQFHRNEKERLLRLLELLQLPPERVDLEEFVQLVQNAHSFSTYLPPTGAMDSLVSSGDLNLLLEPELRALLASFQKRLESMYRTQQWGLVFVNEQLTPFLSKKVPLVVFGYSGQDVKESLLAYYTEPEIEGYATELLESLEFENLLHTRLLAAELLAMKTEALAEEATRVCALAGFECLPS